MEGTPSTRNAKTEGRFPHPDKGFFRLAVVGTSHRTGWTGVVIEVESAEQQVSEATLPSREAADWEETQPSLP